MGVQRRSIERWEQSLPGNRKFDQDRLTSQHLYKRNGVFFVHSTCLLMFVVVIHLRDTGLVRCVNLCHLQLMLQVLRAALPSWSMGWQVGSPGPPERSSELRAVELESLHHDVPCHAVQ